MRSVDGMAKIGPTAAPMGLRDLRRDRGWTAAELATAVGCDAATIVSIELGRMDVLPFAQGIAEALGVSVSDVVLGVGRDRATVH